jgi:HPt (histidine-containing phosphotransfer) domain-containing protein
MESSCKYGGRKMNSEMIYSTMADDADFAELIEMFVEEMPDRIENLLSQSLARDWTNLAKSAHQLKGAAGSYGFDVVTDAAARVEAAVKQGQPEEDVHSALEEIVSLARRMRSGMPSA